MDKKSIEAVRAAALRDLEEVRETVRQFIGKFPELEPQLFGLSHLPHDVFFVIQQGMLMLADRLSRKRFMVSLEKLEFRQDGSLMLNDSHEISPETITAEARFIFTGRTYIKSSGEEVKVKREDADSLVAWLQAASRLQPSLLNPQQEGWPLEVWRA